MVVCLFLLQGILNNLRDAGEPMTNIMAKSVFLQKIRDRDYAHIVDTLVNNSHNLEQCMQQILDKYNMLDANRDPKGKANQAKQDKGKGKKDEKRMKDRHKNETKTGHNNNTNT